MKPSSAAFTGVAGGSGHDHDVLAGRANPRLHSTCDTHASSCQAGEHLKCNVFKKPVLDVEELKQPVLTDSGNKGDDLGVPETMRTLNAAVNSSSEKYQLRVKRKHVISGVLEAPEQTFARSGFSPIESWM